MDKGNDFTRNLLFFAGGFLAGYAVKVVIESDMFKEFTENASDMVDNYFNNEIEYVDIEIDDPDDNESDIDRIKTEIIKSREEVDDIEVESKVDVDDTKDVESKVDVEDTEDIKSDMADSDVKSKNIKHKINVNIQ